MSTIIYGSSDDCIEFDGDLVAEGYLAIDMVSDVALSNGLRFRISYDDEWTIKVMNPVGDYRLLQVGSPEIEKYSVNDYSDVLVIDESVEWAVVGKLAE